MQLPQSPRLSAHAVAAALTMALLATLASASMATAATEIPSDPPNGPSLVPDFVGAAAKADEVNAPVVPQHPFMAPNGLSNVHNDGYQSDTYTWPGPLGKDPTVNSQFFGTVGLCGITIGFDPSGRLVTICVSGTTQQLRLLDPETLDTLATYDGLPPRVIPPGVSPFVSGGGAYFYIDQKRRAVISTGRTIQVVAIKDGAGGPSFELADTYDVTSVVPEDDSLNSAVPDWKGRLWFVSRFDGVVGAIDQESGEVIDSIQLDEEIENSFAADDEGGVYVVTDEAMYRFDLKGGKLKTTWRKRYKNSHVQKPGQLGAGSGTTPTVMGRKYVAITDNADPMNIVVYRRAKNPSKSRTVCTQPVFEKGASATENSLIGTGKSLVVENNYGYAPPPTVTTEGGTTTPGIERVDIVKKGKKTKCKTRWHSDEIAPSVVPKLSLATGLVYTVTKPAGTPDAWYVTAIDFDTGRTAWSKLLGTGLYYNNHYAGIAINPFSGDLYTGVLGGTVRLADG